MPEKLTSPADARGPGRRPSPEKRAAILAAARAVFLEDGFAGASMNRIADKAAVSKATLYNHFQDKEALFAAVLEQRYRALDAALPEFDAEAAPETALADYARALLAEIRDPGHMALTRLIVGEQARFPALSEVYFTVGKAAVYNKVAAYIASLAARPGYDIPNTKLAAGQFLGAIKELLYWPVMFGGRPLADDETAIRAIASNAVRAWRAKSGG